MGYLLKTLVGSALFLGSVVLFNVKLLAVLEVGTCASGGPYAISRPCPPGTGTDILLLVASVFVGLIGATIFALRGRSPWREKRASPWFGGLAAWTIYFAGTGGVVLYASLTSDTYGEDSRLGGIIVGGTFLLLGLPVLAFMLWDRIDDWRTGPAPDDRFTPSTPTIAAPMAPRPTPSTPAAPVAAAGGGEDTLDRLERLQRLRESGALSDSEFEQQKRRLLGGA